MKIERGIGEDEKKYILVKPETKDEIKFLEEFDGSIYCYKTIVGLMIKKLVYDKEPEFFIETIEGSHLKLKMDSE